MQILRDDFSSFAGETVLTIGKFDGIHRGHKQLLTRVQEQAAALRVHAGLLTFDPHPAAVLSPKGAPPLITPLPDKQRLLYQFGLDVLAIATFTREFANLRAYEFLTYISDGLHPRALVVGPDFRFGHKREGDIAYLREWGGKNDVAVHVIEPVMTAGERVSGSRVRELLLAGNVVDARTLLGRSPSVTGTVVEGDRRGTKIGVPTANVVPPSDQALPADGVYITLVNWEGNQQPAVTNVGVRPTVDGTQRFVESHLLDWSGDLYGRILTTNFLQRLRPEKKFDSLDELIEQIKSDVETARQWFENHTTDEIEAKELTRFHRE